jgi:HPt (histidine-containing phosphotransfer) domain-containing protein
MSVTSPSFDAGPLAILREDLPPHAFAACVARAIAALERELDAVAAVHDARARIEAAHRLAGLAGMYGFATLATAARAIEHGAAVDGGLTMLVDHARLTLQQQLSPK